MIVDKKNCLSSVLQNNVVRTLKFNSLRYYHLIHTPIFCSPFPRSIMTYDMTRHGFAHTNWIGRWKRAHIFMYYY
jgi:hypothetical protein